MVDRMIVSDELENEWYFYFKMLSKYLHQKVKKYHELSQKS
jgi:hypothetical protein